MSEVNCVLDHSDFKEQIVRTIPKAENTFKHEYDQRYGQSNQNNMTSDTIRTTLGVVTVTSPVALTQKLETQAKPDVQEVDIGR